MFNCPKESCHLLSVLVLATSPEGAIKILVLRLDSPSSPTTGVSSNTLVIISVTTPSRFTLAGGLI